MATKAENLAGFSPDLIVTPGEQIKELLDEKGLSQRDLATFMGRPYQVVNEIINARKSITAETALQLEDVLGVSAETWMKLESDYRLALARKEMKGEKPEARLIRYWVEEWKAVDTWPEAVTRFLEVCRLSVKSESELRRLIAETAREIESRLNDKDESVGDLNFMLDTGGAPTRALRDFVSFGKLLSEGKGRRKHEPLAG